MQNYLTLLKQTYTSWDEDEAPRLGAALAFYTILSISPLVIFVVALVSLVVSKSSAQSHLVGQVQAMMGAQGGQAIQSLLENAQKPSTGWIASALGFLTLLFGASGVFGELRSALNKIWKVSPQVSSGVWGMLRERFFSFGMVLSIGFLLMVSLVLSAGLAAAGKFFGGLLPMPAWVLSGIDFLVSFAGIAVLFALIFKFVPETKVQWRDVRLGAVITALLFAVGKLLIGLYVGKASVGSAYGAAGSLIVVTIWVYYSAQIFSLGRSLPISLRSRERVCFRVNLPESHCPRRRYLQARLMEDHERKEGATAMFPVALMCRWEVAQARLDFSSMMLDFASMILSGVMG